MAIQSIVLLSGGLDSVYNLYESVAHWPDQVEAISINYGQKAWSSEKRAAQRFCQILDVPWHELDLSSLFAKDSSSLTSDQKMVPTTEVNIEDLSASQKSAEKVWVANRNGVFLNVAATWAESLGAQWIVPGFNAEEAATFPDNSPAFIDKINECLKLSTANGVQVRCFSQNLYKNQIAQSLVEKGAPMGEIWSCYFSGEKPCGGCESCQRFQRALQSTEK